MNMLSRYLDDAYTAWLPSVLACCGAGDKEVNEKQPHSPLGTGERKMAILYDQPRLIPPPLPFADERPSYIRTTSSEWLSRTRSFASKASSRGSFSLKRKLNMYNGVTIPTRRPHIGAPTDFRHVEQGLAPPPKRRSFRPLELSIYREHRLSPLLPYIDPNAPAEDEQEDQRPGHVRSNSAMSMFTIPRKALARNNSLNASTTLCGESIYANSDSGYAGSHGLRRHPSIPDSIRTQELVAAMEYELPQRPAAARLRSNTMPILCEQVERVKTVMQEKEILDRKIRELDDQISERKSLYSKSRPGSLYPGSEVAEPLPALPLAPPQASTSADAEAPRPKTAPSRPTVHIPNRSKSFDEASSAFSSSTASPPPPPLPLFLPRTNPQVRAKKSFSRVSNWLFPGSNAEVSHTRTFSGDSITNKPIPVTKAQGFYQCVPPSATFGKKERHVAQVSVDSGSDESTLNEPNQGWVSSGTTPRSSRDELARTTTFGPKGESTPTSPEIQRQRLGLGMKMTKPVVGVAF